MRLKGSNKHINQHTRRAPMHQPMPVHYLSLAVSDCRVFIFEGHRGKPLPGLNRRASKGRLPGLPHFRPRSGRYSGRWPEYRRRAMSARRFGESERPQRVSWVIRASLITHAPPLDWFRLSMLRFPFSSCTSSNVDSATTFLLVPELPFFVA